MIIVLTEFDTDGVVEPWKIGWSLYASRAKIISKIICRDRETDRERERGDKWDKKEYMDMERKIFDIIRNWNTYLQVHSTDNRDPPLFY